MGQLLDHLLLFPQLSIPDGEGELFSNPNTGGIGGLHLDLSLLIRRQFVRVKYEVT